MGQAAVSWLLPFLPMLDMGSSSAELRRAGNEHRQFVPANYHPTQDGFVLVAVGSDVQWQRLVREPMFSSLARKELLTNERRRARKAQLHQELATLTRPHTLAEVQAVLARAEVPHFPSTLLSEVLNLPCG